MKTGANQTVTTFLVEKKIGSRGDCKTDKNFHELHQWIIKKYVVLAQISTIEIIHFLAALHFRDGCNDVLKLGLERGTAYQKAIHIWASRQLRSIFGVC